MSAMARPSLVKLHLSPSITTANRIAFRLLSRNNQDFATASSTSLRANYLTTYQHSLGFFNVRPTAV